MVMPVTMIKENEKAIIKKITGGRNLKDRLVNIGMTEGEEVELRKSDRCNLIIKVKNSNYVLGYGMAGKILVEVKG